MERSRTLSWADIVKMIDQQQASIVPADTLGDTMDENRGNVEGSIGKGILIGMGSVFASAALIGLIYLLFHALRHLGKGRILLDRFVQRPGQYDDEENFASSEAEALESMTDSERTEYLRAKAFIQANPPETLPTDISLSQFLVIQEKGVSAWEFEPELEVANCFVEARTEIEFFDDATCSVQSNLPVPKQNEVYYWEAKMYEKPETSSISIGFSTKPYPLFRLPGWHKCSVSYSSCGHRRYNQPFHPIAYGPEYVQGDVVGVGYRPRTGSVFFTRNGKRLDDVAHGLKSQNLFPTIGARGPCSVHVNFGQSGFVFIEANVKKWGLAPMTGSLAPPPPYGSEQGSFLIDPAAAATLPARLNSSYPLNSHMDASYKQFLNSAPSNPASPGPSRSPTDISLARLAYFQHDRHGNEGDAATGDGNTRNSTHRANRENTNDGDHHASASAALHQCRDHDRHHADNQDSSALQDPTAQTNQQGPRSTLIDHPSDSVAPQNPSRMLTYHDIQQMLMPPPEYSDSHNSSRTPVRSHSQVGQPNPASSPPSSRRRSQNPSVQAQTQQNTTLPRTSSLQSHSHQRKHTPNAYPVRTKDSAQDQSSTQADEDQEPSRDPHSATRSLHSESQIDSIDADTQSAIRHAQQDQDELPSPSAVPSYDTAVAETRTSSDT